MIAAGEMIYIITFSDLLRYWAGYPIRYLDAWIDEIERRLQKGKEG